MERIEKSRATQTKLRVPAPLGFSYLPYQAAGVDYLMDIKNGLIADPPGLGKTIESIGYLNIKALTKVVIVAPASLLANWKKELEAWLIHPAKIQIIKSGKSKLDETADIFIVSYGLTINTTILKFLRYSRRHDVLILDESQNLKNEKASRTKAVLGDGGLKDSADHVLALSGTPIVNRPMELYTIITALCPEAINYMSRFSYGMRYCGGYKGPFGYVFDGASNMKELGERLRSHFMVRRKKSEVLKDLPKVSRKVIYLNQSQAAKKLVKSEVKFNADEIISKGAEIAFHGLAEARRELGEEKVKQSIDYIITKLDGGHKKIIVFAHHKKVIEDLEKGLKNYNPAVIKGSTPVGNRQDEVDKFQNDNDCRVFIGNILAAGVGITLTSSSYVIFVEFSYVPGENSQAIDRAHRIGQVNPVLAEFLVYENSLDENIILKHIKKSKVIKKIMLD
jgi:SWI/SNF-related matrix-associated actin-dependent regulator 1 of chromatin subfamily A